MEITKIFVATKLSVIEGFMDYLLNIRWKHLS